MRDARKSSRGTAFDTEQMAKTRAEILEMIGRITDRKTLEFAQKALAGCDVTLKALAERPSRK